MKDFEMKNMFSSGSCPEVGFSWQKSEHVPGETELVLPRKLFNAYTISETDDNWNVHDVRCDVIMRADGKPVTDTGAITYSASNIAHNTGRAATQKEISFETLNELIEKSADPEAARYRGMNAGNWKKYLETPVEHLEPSKYPILPFGSYPQIRPGKAKQPVSWFVLDIDDEGTALMISQRGLDVGAWNRERVLVSWEESSLCRYLNGDFAEEMLAETGRGALMPVDGRGGIITIITREELEKYLNNDSAICARPTDYAVRRGANSYDDDNPKYRRFVGCGIWWINSIKEQFGFWNGIYANAVYWDGTMCDYSPATNWPMVRPVIRLDLKKAFGAENAEKLCREFRERING